MREIGIVKQVQIQRASLKVGQKPHQRYDPAPLLIVEALVLSPNGVVGLTADGGQIVDVHHAQHASSKNVNGVNGISLGFTSHYHTMRERFGRHMVDSCAGENILIETEHRYTLADLGRELIIQNPATGASAVLTGMMVAAPCAPFSRFALQQADVRAGQIKAALQFLDAGQRGFYVTVAGRATVQPGDQVFVTG